MTLRRASAWALLPLVAVSACTASPKVPDREPDVTGVVAGANEPGGPVLAEPSDSYFEGMGLVRGDPVVVDADGQATSVATLGDGDAVEVWIEGICGESFPVQCDVTLIRLGG